MPQFPAEIDADREPAILPPADDAPSAAREPEWMAASRVRLELKLVAEHGEAERARVRRGLAQAGQFWRAGDGDEAAFEEFAARHFAGDPATLDTMFERFERLLEQLDGHMHEIHREFRQQLDLERGPLLPFDEAFGGYDPSAHVMEDFFENKLAFTVLLNFPLTTLEERLSQGQDWTRRRWAEVRLAERFSKRVPAEVQLGLARADAQAAKYISEYKICMDHVLDQGGERLFPPNMHLLSHWHLRDQIKSDYSDAQNGVRRQRVIQQVFERIVTQTIPRAVIGNPGLDWNPFSNEVRVASTDPGAGKREEAQVLDAREPDTRYQVLFETFAAARRTDPYSPTAPTLIARRFNEDREIPEERVRAMLEQVVTSALVPEIASLIEGRLGRPLEPFDIWYTGFRPGSAYGEAELDAMVNQRYPSAEAYQKDIPRLLAKLAFSPQRATYLAEKIAVEGARGAGHAMGAGMRTARAHLRTRIESDGMHYNGFSVAAHEMGHNVEQTFSLQEVDHTLLQGVPNTAFTEAFAFIFQARDLELLGLPGPDPRSGAERTLHDFWGTYEIAGVALVDIALWHWMYDHPRATASELKQATLSIAKEIWNRYYAPVFHQRDAVLLGVYSHMIESFLYLPDYPIGHLIAFQIEEQMRQAGNIGVEFERMAKMGRVSPDLWMKNATGRPVGAEALLEAARRALDLARSPV